MSDILLDIHVRHKLHTANGIFPMEIDLTVFKGEILAVTGPSGAGKTTLLRQIAGLVKPDFGRIAYQNTVWLDQSQKINLSPQKRNIGFVFQDYALFPHLTVLENLRFASAKNQPDRIKELLDAVELTALAHRKPHQLSGGQQQRVALARALVRQPDLLLLDEPLAALDNVMRKKLQDYLRTLRQKFNFTVIIVTHDQGEIFGLANRVAALEEGKIVKLGTVVEVFLSGSQSSDNISVYGEILSVELFTDHLKAHVLIQQTTQTLTFPLDQLSQIIPGRSFVLQYSPDNPSFKILG